MLVVIVVTVVLTGDETMMFAELQIDDFKLMKDHQTGRSAGYGFITVSYLHMSAYI